MQQLNQAGKPGGGWAGAGRLLAAVAVVVAAVQLSGTARAQGSAAPAAEPILRIETGLHGAQIKRIDTDAANRFAVTASDDKTVRVWSLPDGKLQRILRLPVSVDNANEGKAFAVAISPDGDTVAVGGWIITGGHTDILLFDRASGALKQRFADLPNVVLHLAYSPNGRRLAASLWGSNGIRVFDAGDGYRPLPSDTRYKDNSYSAMFDRAGRLVTTSWDGLVRLYAAGNYATPIATFESKGHRPYAAAFSPDGTRVAVGYADINDVVVLSGSDLTQDFKADTAGVANVGMNAVSWSPDGRFLFAGGYWLVNDVLQVRRWSDGGRGTSVDIPAGAGTIMQVRGLNDGSMLIAHGRGFGRIGADGKAIRLQGLGGLALNTGGNRTLRVAPDGGTVQVDSWQPTHSYRFALARRVIDIDPPADAALTAPVTAAAGLAVTNWFNSRTPAVNKAAITLEVYDIARSVAIVPGTKRLVLGTSFSLRLIDDKAQDVWPKAQPVPGEAWHVNVSGDGRLVVAAYDDGSIRWHRLSDGQELLALFMHPDGQRWILWTPQGYYDAAAGADDLIGWQVNQGRDRAPDFYPASQFRDRFYRPDVIQRVLATLDVAQAVRDADQAAGRSTATAVSVRALLTPVVAIKTPKSPAAVDKTDLELSYFVQMPSPDDRLIVEALVDGVKVPADDTRLVDRGGERAGILKLTKLPRRDSMVSILAYNKNGAGEPAKIQVQWRGPGRDPKLTLYVLAIGISDYFDKTVKLRFAAKDAADFVALARAQEGGLYEKVITHPPGGSLRDGDATKDAILDELDWIKRAVTNTNDVAMILLAGHGITTPDQRYRFLPHNYDANRVERTTISDAELQDYLTKIGGKKIFFFDTCYSGAVLSGRAATTQPDVDRFANQLRAAENGIVVFTSSTGNELAQEKEEWNNGAFTKAVVEGMRGAAAQPQAPVIMISDLNGYVSRRVRELTNGNQRPMMAMPKTVEDYPIARRLQ